MSGPVYEVAAGPALQLSFQRYRCPPTGQVDAPATSCGALPVLGSPGLWRVPCPRGEALWVGLLPTADTTVAVRALGAELRVDAPPVHALFGVPGAPAGSWAFARAAAGPPACHRIDLTVTAGGERTVLAVELIDPAAYTELTGLLLPPLDEGAAYGGWLLP